MAGGTFSKCESCDRLTIRGQQCVCDETTPRRCDCTHDGNKQHIGAGCQQRIDDEWARVIALGSARA